MRPAQKAPENREGGLKSRPSPKNFNEAGAKSAGKPRRRKSCSRIASTLQ